ncbi:MAG: zf-HC2 domain-containing protein [Candidatus Aminicenantes bacterium]|nr:zf-HC2 domain-containing protein [Candidatus Aminicenantes bacterium]
MVMDCIAVEKSLVAIAENSIPERRLKELRLHLESCSNCSLLVKRFTKIWQKIGRGEQIEPSSSFWIELQQKMSAREERKFWLADVFIGARRLFRPAALVFTLIAGIFAGYQIGNVPQDSGTARIEGKVRGANLEEPISAPYFESFEDYPKGSVTDFYLSSIIEKKE